MGPLDLMMKYAETAISLKVSRVVSDCVDVATPMGKGIVDYDLTKVAEKVNTTLEAHAGAVDTAVEVTAEVTALYLDPGQWLVDKGIDALDAAAERAAKA